MVRAPCVGSSRVGSLPRLHYAGTGTPLPTGPASANPACRRGPAHFASVPTGASDVHPLTRDPRYDERALPLPTLTITKPNAEEPVGYLERTAADRDADGHGALGRLHERRLSAAARCGRARR